MGEHWKLALHSVAFHSLTCKASEWGTIEQIINMASPQKENGFTPIANEILEQLVKVDLLASELRILLFIIRKTYGYQKKYDQISFTQFEKGTNISRQTINKTLKNLMAKGLIVKICLPGGNIGYSFIKDHENWIVKTHLLVKGKWETSKDVFTKTSKDVLTHKRKKEITKEIAETSSADIVLVFDMFIELNPAVKRMFGNTTQRKACKELIDIHGLERLKKIILETLPRTNRLQYFPIITTPLQLLDKFTTLESAIIKYQSDKKLKGIADINKKNDLQNYIG